MKLFVEKKTSTKTQNDYICLYADLGYRVIAISMDTAIIAEISDLRISELLALEVNKPFVVGEVLRKKV